MQKIISLFARDYDGDRHVVDAVVPGAEWVTAGEGSATRKWDGTCCLVRGGRIFRRFDAKHGKTPPRGFEPAQEPDPTTGHWPGWILVGDGPADRWHREAWDPTMADGTYELIGPKVQGNPEGMAEHILVRHGTHVLHDAPRDYAGLRAYLATANIEGIVWHNHDGRMVKIKTKDFGLRRPKW
jgi:Family of unknown function (DUF5565)